MIVAYVDCKPSFTDRVLFKLIGARIIGSEHYPDIYRQVDLAKVERTQEIIVNSLFHSVHFERAITGVGKSSGLEHRSSRSFFASWFLRTTRTRLFRLLCIKELYPNDFVFGSIGLGGKLNLEVLSKINGKSLDGIPRPLEAWLSFCDFFAQCKSIFKVLALTFLSMFLPIFSWVRNFSNANEFKFLRGRVAVAAFGIPLFNDRSKLSLYNFLSEVSGHNQGMKFLAVGAKGAHIPIGNEPVVRGNLKFCSHPINLKDWLWLLKKQGAIVASLFTSAAGRSIFNFAVELAKCVFYAYKFRSLRISSVILTSSEVSNPLLGSSARLAGIPISFIYYSSNVSPLIVSGKASGSLQNPYMKNLDADCHIIWDEGFRRLMAETYGYARNSLVVAGPIMFASSSLAVLRKAEQVSEDTFFSVGVFDITPMGRNVWMRRYMGVQHYTTEKSEAFFKDIFEVISNFPERRIRLVCKKKRPTPMGEDPRYESIVKEILDSSQLEVLEFPPDANPYSVIQHCDAVVSLPFTSITQAASYLGMPASYYWPGPSLENEVNPVTPVLYSQNELREWLTGIQQPSVLKDFSNVTRIISQNIPTSYSHSGSGKLEGLQ